MQVTARLCCVGRSGVRWEAESRHGTDWDNMKEVSDMAKQRLKRHVINRDWCKGCGICVHFCPKKVLELDDKEKAVVARAEDCVACKLC